MDLVGITRTSFIELVIAEFDIQVFRHRCIINASLNWKRPTSNALTVLWAPHKLFVKNTFLIWRKNNISLKKPDHFISICEWVGFRARMLHAFSNVEFFCLRETRVYEFQRVDQYANAMNVIWKSHFNGISISALQIMACVFRFFFFMFCSFRYVIVVVVFSSSNL